MARLTRVLVVNAGSSSLKWSVLDAENGKVLAGSGERWRGADAGQRMKQMTEMVTTAGAVDAAGHRVTQGGMQFRAAVRLDVGVRQALEKLVPLDERHLGPALAGIAAVTLAHPALPQIAAFDTAFHATMPAGAAQYAIPVEWTEGFEIRRFGFHGLSVDWAVSRAAELLGGVPAKLVVCHLGSGCSVTAVESGRSVDTTMGFSPLEGVMMATRSGSIDSGAILHLIMEKGLRASDIRTTLAEASGWFGVSGVSADLRDVLAAADGGNERARLASELFVQSLRRSIGAMAGVLGGADTVVFTGGIGEASARIRAQAAAALPGLWLDPGVNAAVGAEDAVISAPDSATRALVVHAREDLVILREASRLLR